MSQQPRQVIPAKVGWLAADFSRNIEIALCLETSDLRKWVHHLFYAE